MQNKVTATPNGYFLVESGRTGKTYMVTPLGGDRADCTCEAGRNGRLCHHVRSVQEYGARLLAELNGNGTDPFARIKAEEGK